MTKKVMTVTSVFEDGKPSLISAHEGDECTSTEHYLNILFAVALASVERILAITGDASQLDEIKALTQGVSEDE